MKGKRSAEHMKGIMLVVLAMVLLLALAGPALADDPPPPPFIQVTKDGPPDANAGEEIVYVITIQTYGQGTVTEAEVWDDLQYAGLERYEIFRRALTAEEMAALNNGDPVVIEVPYVVPCDAGGASGHVIDNDAYVHAVFSDGSVLNDANDHDVSVPPDPSVSCEPSIDLEKLVNGEDADPSSADRGGDRKLELSRELAEAGIECVGGGGDDVPDGVVVDAGAELTFEYRVTNDGDAALFNITVVDDNETPDDPSDDITVGEIVSLAPGQTKSFFRTATAECGVHTNWAVASGTSSGTSGSVPVSDSDAATYSARCAPCVKTAEYWINNPDAWPQDRVRIGGRFYQKEAAISWMKKDCSEDKTVAMFRALVTAKLNVMAGNPWRCAIKAILLADCWMAKFGPVGRGVPSCGWAWRLGQPLYQILDAYNNGLLCASGCD